MGIFDINSLGSEASKSVFADALAMTTYTYHNLDNGLAWGYQHTGFKLGLPATLLTALFGNSHSQGIIPGLPWNPDSEAQSLEKLNKAGWQTISAKELGYTGRVDDKGTFHGEKLAYATAQAEILGKYDQSGNLIQIGVAFRGTSGPRESLIVDTIGDVIHDLQAAFCSKEFSDTFATNAFGKLLGAVARYADSHNLSGKDVLVSGHSLGGLAVNSLASQSETFLNGFYSDAKYVAFASPTQNENNNKVLNAGFENDPVFRVLDGTDLNLSSLLVHDSGHVTSTDNIVNFNDYYASDLWNVLPQSILNLPSWLSHMPFFYEQAMNRILDSEFYSLTERDSTVIVSTLSDTTRGSTWVQDLNRYAEKHTGPTFILGSDKNDLIRGGSGTDYLEGGKGNDTFQTGGGYNIVLGGEGKDTIDLQDKLSNTEFAWDGETLYLRDKTGAITLANSVENIQSREKYMWFFPTEKTHEVTDAGLKCGNTLTSYAASVTGDDGNNFLTSTKNGSWLFGLEGDDILRGSGNNTFVGGEGDDTLIGAGRNNTYLFSGHFDRDTIYNFGATDKLVFLGVEGATSGRYQDYVTQHDHDLVFNFGDNSVTLIGVNMDTLAHAQIVLA